MGVIYLARNTVNGKGYVGKTKYTLERRKRSHLRSSKQKKSIMSISRAIRKYGEDVFVWSVLYKVKDDIDLDKFEKRAIKEQGTRAPAGYNQTSGGDGGDTFTGRKHREESKRKIGETRVKRGIKSWNEGKKHSPSTRRKISKATTGRTAWNKGKKMNPSFAAKRLATIAKNGGLTAWNKGLTGFGPTWNKGIPMSEEAKTKLKASLKAIREKKARVSQ